MPVSIEELLEWTGGEPHGAPPDSFEGAAIDSRKTAPGSLYAALQGDHAHGREFAAQAIAAGAALVMTDGDPVYAPDGTPLPCVTVRDSRRALADAARGYRKTLRAAVAGVTGSAGKTSTKEFLAAFLRSAGKTSATEGNFNNDLGLPLSILNAARDSAFCVFECGSNHPGEIAALAGILQPDCAAISSIGEAHIEHFGSLDGTAREKGALFEAVPESGFCVLSRENLRFGALKAMSKARVVEVSMRDASAPFHTVSADPAAGRFTVAGPDGETTALDIGVPGEYNISNALIAFAAARTLGADADACAKALEGFSLPGRRWRKTVRDGVTWIDDAYNANPASMQAALRNFAKWPCKGRRIAVLGDMFELGPRAGELHAATARAAAECGIDIVVAAGGLMESAFAPAYHAAAPGATIVTVADAATARALMPAILREGDTVLLKGSRGMKMEQVYE